MGILLHGKPGTGKTSCIKAIASMTNRHLFEIPLRNIKTQKELKEIFYGSKVNGVEMDFKKKIYILEEFDCIIDRFVDRKLKKSMRNNETNFDDGNNNSIEQKFNNNLTNTPVSNLNYQNRNRNNMESTIPGINYNSNSNLVNNNFTNLNQSLYENDSEGVTLDGLLTILDGCVEQHGPIFIATTNHIDLIDKALIRPGRFDICLKLDNANEEIIIQMINHFNKKNKKNKKNIKKLNKSIKSIKSIKSNSSSITNSIKSKLTDEHIEKINRLSKYNEQYLWSPAKISQICLFNIDNENYINKVIEDMENEYDEQSKLL